MTRLGAQGDRPGRRPDADAGPAAVIEAELGLDAHHQMDPTTIVAAGAALFASTQKLPAALRPALEARPSGSGLARARVRVDDDQPGAAAGRPGRASRRAADGLTVRVLARRRGRRVRLRARRRSRPRAPSRCRLRCARGRSTSSGSRRRATEHRSRPAVPVLDPARDERGQAAAVAVGRRDARRQLGLLVPPQGGRAAGHGTR